MLIYFPFFFLLFHILPLGKVVVVADDDMEVFVSHTAVVEKHAVYLVPQQEDYAHIADDEHYNQYLLDASNEYLSFLFSGQ